MNYRKEGKYMNTVLKRIMLTATLIVFSQLATAQSIFEAVEKGDVEKVKILLKDNPNCINQRDEKSGFTPLHKAASNGQADICRLLIEKGADIHAIDNSQITPLLLASSNNQIEVAVLLINKGANIHQCDKQGGTNLHFAALGGHIEMIKLYIDKGIDVNVPDNMGYTPIIWAIFGRSTDAMDDLQNYGGDLNQTMLLGRTALHYAAASGDIKVVEYLLNKGLDVNSKSEYGNTPIFWALRAKKYDNAKTMIENGADLNISNYDGRTPISFAVSNNDTMMVDLMSKNGVNIKKRNSTGDTHLHAAAYEGLIEMVTFLLGKSINSNIANNQGITALDLAISRNHLEVQQLLDSKGAEQGKGKEKNNDQLTKIGKPSSGAENPVKVTIIYDNYISKKGMEAHWGFSCYIEDTEKNILFDTGTKSDLFIHNMNELAINHNNVDIVVLSHEHGDHTGGLFPFLEMNNDLSVLMPYSFSYDFVRRVESHGTNALTVKKPIEICNDVYLSGELDARMNKEQSLAINTRKGLVIIVGCSHPGIINILESFKEILNKNIYMVIGGFHLMNNTELEVNQIINQMKELGVQKCGATHCTGEKQIKLFKEAFAENYVQMGVGRVITF